MLVTSVPDGEYEVNPIVSDCMFSGALLAANQGRIAVLVTMLYAAYTMKCHGGWLGLLFTHALAFVSSDLALYFLSTVEKEEKFSQTKAEYVPPFQQKSSFNGRSSSDGNVPDSFDSARSSAGASTSGVNDGDPLSAEEEVARVLGCNDHYGVLGFARYEIFDVSSLKREYRKKVAFLYCPATLQFLTSYRCKYCVKTWPPLLPTLLQLDLQYFPSM